MLYSAISKRFFLCAFGFLALGVLTYVLRPFGLTLFGLNLKISDLQLFDNRILALLLGSLPSFSIVVFLSLLEIGVLSELSSRNLKWRSNVSLNEVLLKVSKWLLFFTTLELVQLTDWASPLHLSGWFDPLDLVAAFLGSVFSLFLSLCILPVLAKQQILSQAGLQDRLTGFGSVFRCALFGFGLFSSLATSSPCGGEGCPRPSTARCSIVTASREGLVNWKEPQPLMSAGKILVSGDKLLVSDYGRGVHVIDNANPAEPKPLGYLSIPHNEDFALKDGILYANVGSELAVIDLRNLPEVKVLDLQSSVFDCNRQANLGVSRTPNASGTVSVQTEVPGTSNANNAPKPSTPTLNRFVTCSFASTLDACLVLFESEQGNILRSCRTPKARNEENGTVQLAMGKPTVLPVVHKCEVEAFPRDRIVKYVNFCSESQSFVTPDQSIVVSDSDVVLDFSTSACSSDTDSALTLLSVHPDLAIFDAHIHHLRDVSFRVAPPVSLPKNV